MSATSEEERRDRGEKENVKDLRRDREWEKKESEERRRSRDLKRVVAGRKRKKSSRKRWGKKRDGLVFKLKGQVEFEKSLSFGLLL